MNHRKTQKKIGSTKSRTGLKKYTSKIIKKIEWVVAPDLSTNQNCHANERNVFQVLVVRQQIAQEDGAFNCDMILMFEKCLMDGKEN